MPETQTMSARSEQLRALGDEMQTNLQNVIGEYRTRAAEIIGTDTELGNEVLQGASELRQSQFQLAEAKAEVMRPTLRSWFRRAGSRERFEAAQQANMEAQKEAFSTVIESHQSETGDIVNEDELRTLAVASVIENKTAVDTYAVNHYEGTKSGKFISFIRNRGSFTKGFMAGGQQLLTGGVIGNVINAAVVSRIGRNHIGDNKEDIEAADAEATSVLSESITQLNGDVVEDIVKMRELSAVTIHERAEAERKAVAREVAPIAIGGATGFLLNGSLEAAASN